MLDVPGDESSPVDSRRVQVERSVTADKQEGRKEKISLRPRR